MAGATDPFNLRACLVDNWETRWDDLEDANREGWDWFPDLEPHDLINGDPADIRPYVIKGTLPTHLDWVPIAGLPPSQASKEVDLSVRAHLWHVEKTAPSSMTAPAKRRAGVVLGVMRAMMTTSYGLTPNHLTPGEVALSPYRYTPAAADASSSTRPAKGKAKIIVKPPRTRTVEGAEEPVDPEEKKLHDILSANVELSDAEKALVGGLVKVAEAVLPLQGHNLLAEGHHYLSTPNSAGMRAFKAVESQHLRSAEIREVLGEDLDAYRNLMWHASGHPVLVSVKETLATNPKIVSALKASDLGSACARLPAMEAEVKSASSYLKLADNVASTFEEGEGSIDREPLRAALGALQQFPRGMAGPTGGVRLRALGSTREAPLIVVSTREEVLKYLADLVSKIRAPMAHMLGFYKAQWEDASGGEGGEDTLLKAFSIKRLQTDQPADYFRGRSLYRDYKNFQAERRKAGFFAGPKVDLI